MKFLSAISFITIIKIPQKYCIKTEKYQEILVFFTIVGIIIGILNAAVLGVFNLFLPLVISVIFMAGFETVLTGGIHIDGLADLFDGTFSGETDKKKIIEIMKKGDSGVFGILAIFFSLSLKVSVLYFTARALLIPDFIVAGFSRQEFLPAATGFLRGFPALLPVLVFAPVYGRLSMLYMFSSYGPANTGAGLSVAFRDKSNREIFILSYIYLSVLFVAVCMFSQMYFFNTLVPESLSASSPGQAGSYGFMLSRYLFTGSEPGFGSGLRQGYSFLTGMDFNLWSIPGPTIIFIF